MPSETITFKDAVVKVNAPFIGATTVTVTCRNYKATLTTEAFAELVYPSIDASAREFDPPSKV